MIREDAIGVHVSMIHTITGEPGSSTRWLIQKIELTQSETSPGSEGADTKPLLPEENER